MRSRRIVRPRRGADRGRGPQEPGGPTKPLALEPDVVAFAKKVQLGGSWREGESTKNQTTCSKFRGGSALQWGGGLSDMVRSTRILRDHRARGRVDRQRCKGLDTRRSEHSSRSQQSTLFQDLQRVVEVVCCVRWTSRPHPSEIRVVSLLRENEHVIVLPLR